MNRSASAAVLVALAFPVLGCGGEEPRAEWPAEVVLRTITEGRELFHFSVAQNGKDWIALEVGSEAEKRRHFIVGSRLAERSYDCACGPVISEDGEHWAVLACREVKNFVVHDGVEGPEFDTAQWPPVLADSGRTAITCGQRGDDAWFQVGKELLGPFRGKAWSLQGGPFGRKVLATVAVDDDDAGMHAVVNGRDSGSFASIGSVKFSENGQRIAFRGEDPAGGTVLVVDGFRSPSYEAATVPVFSADAGCVAYGALREGAWEVVVGNSGMRDLKTATRLDKGTGPDGIYAFDVGERRVVVAATVDDGRFTLVRGVAFAGEGRASLLFAGDQVFVDGVPSPRTGALWSVARSPSGRRVALAYQGVGIEIVVDQELVLSDPKAKWPFLPLLLEFSADERQLRFAVSDGRRIVLRACALSAAPVIR